MTRTFPCPNCRELVPFEKTEQGANTYCPLCGRLCLVPIDAAATAVFSKSGAERAQERIVRSVTCTCGHTFAVRAREIADTIYCPSCHSECGCGADLGNQRSAAISPPAPPITVAGTRTHWLRLIASFCLIAAMAVVAVNLIRNSAETRHSVSAIVSPPYWESNVGAEYPVEAEGVTPAAITALEFESPAIVALMRGAGWQRALHEQGVAPNDPRYTQLQSVLSRIVAAREAELLHNCDDFLLDRIPKRALQRAQGLKRLLQGVDLSESRLLQKQLDRLISQLLERAEPITLADINTLPNTPDTIEALVRAQLWHDALASRGAAASDPRMLRLAEIFVQLRNKLVPIQPRPSENVVKLRDLISEVARLLEKNDVAAAADAMERIERLADESPEEIGPHAHRYFELKGQLNDQQLIAEGAQGIRGLLNQAEQFLAADQITEALEAKARAKVLARASVMSLVLSSRDADALRRQLAELAPKLRFSQGCRAVKDALRCEAAGDEAARNSQVRDAYRHFSGLSEEDIQPWLEQVAPWHDAATGAVRTQYEENGTTTMGRELEMRRQYELMLHFYEEEDLDGCLTTRVDLRPVFGRQQFERLRRQAEPHLFELIEQKLNHIIALQPGRVALDELQQARTILDRASFLHDSPRWKLLDSSLRHHESMTAKATAN